MPENRNNYSGFDCSQAMEGHSLVRLELLQTPRQNSLPLGSSPARAWQLNRLRLANEVSSKFDEPSAILRHAVYVNSEFLICAALRSCFPDASPRCRGQE